MDKIDIIKEIQDKLFEYKDEKYHDFHCKLMPTVATDVVIGVRTPDIRKLGKLYAKNEKIDVFLCFWKRYAIFVQ